MRSICFLAGLMAGMLVRCGGGGEAGFPPAAPPVVLAPASATAAAPAAAFSELWESLTVAGVVTPQEQTQTPDGSDPRLAWASSAIAGKWGTLRTLDGTVPGLPDVSGSGPNASWALAAGRLAFHAAPATAATGQSTGGFALLSRQTFSRAQRISIEADVDLTQGTLAAFAGLALIAGEGSYRELAIYRRATGDSIDRVTPLTGAVLMARPPGPVRLRIDYDPATGFRYFVNGALAGTEAIGHLGAGFDVDPGVGLYFTADSSVPGAFAEGFVGPIRVWTSSP